MEILVKIDREGAPLFPILRNMILRNTQLHAAYKVMP
jgi:hypothetical protein